ncbi:STN domain-containing protein [Bradyrhizobium cenepequi]
MVLALWTSVSVIGNATAAFGQADAQAFPESPISFDIPAQQLTSALDAYSLTAGLQVLYDSKLGTMRRSTALRGVLPPDLALRILLEGTGLTAVYSGNSFAVVQFDSDRRTSGPEDVRYTSYFALIQGSIERAFCRHPETMPGRYRLALQFGIGMSGEVLRPRLLATTGVPRRDAMIADLLNGLTIEQPPPSTMPQPVTMIVSPRSPDQTGDCSPAGNRSLRRGEQ